jgi:hypothetical protein
VKRANLHTRYAKLTQSISEFAGSSGGKRNGQSLAGIVYATGYRVCDPVRDGSSLTCASTGKNSNWSRDTLGRSALLVV